MAIEDLPALLDARPVPADERAALRFTETLPLALVSLLERRFLAPFQTSNWDVRPREGDIARPLLREVLSLGRPHRPEEWVQAMPHVLTASHDPGHSLVMALYGQGDRHRLFLGGRRVIGAGARSTEDYLLAQESAFKSYFSGLRMGPVRRLDSEEQPDLAGFVQTAPALGVVTGIPSRRDPKGGPVQFQSLDRLVNAVGEQRYALFVVAEPLDPWAIDTTLDACRHLRSEVHGYVRRTINRSKSTSETHGEQQEKEPGLKSQLPYYLYGLAIFANLAGAFSGLGPGVVGALLSRLGPLAGSAQSMGMMTNMWAMRENMENLSRGESFSESGSEELMNANAEACEALLQKHVERLQSARSSGWWRTAVYIAAESEAALNSVQGALRSLCGGEATSLDPIRTLSLPDSLLRDAVERGQVLRMRPSIGEQGHPLGEPFDTLGTCLNSDELSVLVNMPQAEIPGLPMRDQSDFALSVPLAEGNFIPLGHLQDGQGRDLGTVAVSSQSINRHVFVTVGSPGTELEFAL